MCWELKKINDDKMMAFISFVLLCLFQVYNHDVLPGYHFRDDAILLYYAINKYVKKYVDLYYGEYYE